MKKIAYIIPGYGESCAEMKSYNKVSGFFESNDIEPVFVPIDWKAKHPAEFSDYMDQFLKIYKKPKNTKVYILGFSFGAMIALLTASKTKPDGLILCSLSPYFEEDLPKIQNKWAKWFGKNFVHSTYSFNKFAPKVKSTTVLVVGDKEDKECQVRSKLARKTINKSILHIAKGAKHDIGQKAYLATLQKVISKLK